MGQDIVALSTKSCHRGLCNVKTGWLWVHGIMGVRDTADSQNKVRGRGCWQRSSSHWGETLLLDFSGFSIFGATVWAPDTRPRHLKPTPTKGTSPSFCSHQHSHPLFLCLPIQSVHAAAMLHVCCSELWSWVSSPPHLPVDCLSLIPLDGLMLIPSNV